MRFNETVSAMDSGKLLRTVLIVVIAGAAISGTTDNVSQQYAEQALTRALATFTVARTLNGVISVAQGTEVAVEPGGVGVIFTPGQVLDPVNDLIERFSWVMLASTTSLGIQNILLDMSRWWGIRLIAGLAALAAALVWLLPGLRQASWWPWLLRLVLLALFVRLAVPLVMIANNAVYQVFLEPRYQASSALIEEASEELEAIGVQQDEQQKTGLLGSVNRALEQVQIKQRLENFKQRASQVIEQLITLTAVFLLQTIVLPLLFLWVLLVSFKRLVSWPGTLKKTTSIIAQE